MRHRYKERRNKGALVEGVEETETCIEKEKRREVTYEGWLEKSKSLPLGEKTVE